MGFGCLGGFQIDDQLEIGRPLDRHLAGLRTLDDAIDIRRDALVEDDEAGAVGHQPTVFDLVSPFVDRGQAVPGGELDDRLAVVMSGGYTLLLLRQ